MPEETTVWFCTQCGAELGDLSAIKQVEEMVQCGNCNLFTRPSRTSPERPPVQQAAAARFQPDSDVTKKYGATRVLVSLLRFIAWIALVMGVGAFALDTTAILALPGAVVAFGLLLASAEGMQVVLDMEEHQRAIRLLLEEQLRA